MGNESLRTPNFILREINKHFFVEPASGREYDEMGEKEFKVYIIKENGEKFFLFKCKTKRYVESQIIIDGKKYTSYEDVIKAVYNENKEVEFPFNFYDPDFTELERTRKMVHWYMTDVLGLTVDQNMKTYRLRDGLGLRLLDFRIVFNAKDENDTSGRFIRTLNGKDTVFQFGNARQCVEVANTMTSIQLAAITQIINKTITNIKEKANAGFITAKEFKNIH